jgi:hypothetical protein
MLVGVMCRCHILVVQLIHVGLLMVPERTCIQVVKSENVRANTEVRGLDFSKEDVARF